MSSYIKKAALAAAVSSLAFACSASQTGSNARSNRTASNQNLASSRPADGTYVPTPTPAQHDAPRISLAEAKKEYDAGSAVFIDTHSADQYAKQHIPGAINITVSDLAAKEDKIPKGKKIIAYCS